MKLSFMFNFKITNINLSSITSPDHMAMILSRIDSVHTSLRRPSVLTLNRDQLQSLESNSFQVNKQLLMRLNLKISSTLIFFQRLKSKDKDFLISIPKISYLLSHINT
jgi:hypothetical protein